MRNLNILLLLLSVTTLAGCWPAVVGGAAVGTAVAVSKDRTAVAVSKDRTAEETAEDVRISAAIRKDLATIGLYKKIDFQVVKGRVMYTGHVASHKDVVEAVRIAWKQNGVHEVINELKITQDSNHFNTKQYSKDTWITSTLKAKTLGDHDVKFSNYTVVTTDGTVYLFGIARSQAELNKVKDIARNIKGVKNVVSHVHVK